jgi:hypothetical protein
MPGVETIGGNSYVWVHANCAPTRHKKHGRSSKKR